MAPDRNVLSFCNLDINEAMRMTQVAMVKGTGNIELEDELRVLSRI